MFDQSEPILLVTGVVAVPPTGSVTRNVVCPGRESTRVGTEMSLNVLAYNLTRVLRILGFKKTMKAMRLVGA
ncbi:hypothetical protein [Paraburkholderia kirstenboschensis]|uniref:hypothetical protein n=1 Tax=Paraburkholderia kirstenboschensis TaxID=1245436 RepID=UPI000FFC1865|nr:hypothetical protein [Paraburkholderia kirstenboschensis]